MKHFRIPEAAVLIDPNTGEPSKATPAIPFARAWYLAIMGAVKRGPLETIPAHDLYDKVRSKKPGAWVDLTEPEYEAILPEFKKGEGGALSPEYLMSARDHVRAVVKAYDEVPVALVPNAPDAGAQDLPEPIAAHTHEDAQNLLTNARRKRVGSDEAVGK